MRLFTNSTVWDISHPVSVSGPYITTNSTVYYINDNQLIEYLNIGSLKKQQPYTQQLQIDKIINIGSNLIIRYNNTIRIINLEHKFDDQSLTFTDEFHLLSFQKGDFSFITIILKSQVIILKYENDIFVDRYNLFLSNIKHLSLLSENEVVAMHDNKADLIYVNLSTSKVSHFDLSSFIKFKTAFLNYRKDLINSIYCYSNNIIIEKHNTLINVKFTKNLKNPFTLNNIEKLKQGYQINITFPFIFIVYEDTVEVRSIENFTLLQKFSSQDIRYLYHENSILRIITDESVKEYKLCNIETLIEYLENDIDNAILMIETFTPFTNFIQLRKFKLKKAISLLSTCFTDAIDIMIDYLAAPVFVFSHLPTTVKQLFQLDELIDENQKNLINDLIRYLTDSRWKLIRLRNEKYTEFNVNGREISLDVYKSDDGFNLDENLKLLDNHLFKCYLLINRKMIIPFLRRNTFCDSDLVEESCKRLHLNEQLVVFYSMKKSYEKCIEILDDHEKLIEFFQKLIQLNNPPIDLIFNYKSILLEGNNFRRIFINDDLDYTNIDCNVILENITNAQLDLYKTEYLEYLVFTLNVHKPEIINDLFDVYFNDIKLNFEKIQKLYEIGIFNSNQLLKRLRSMPESIEAKKLMIQPLLKLRRYDDILSIFINDLEDVNGSVEFCLKIRNLKNDSLCRGLIFKTIDLCLINKDHHSIINYILNNPDLDFINFEEILLKLPKDISMNLMSKFLVMNLKNLNSVNNNIIIKNEVLKVNLIDSQLNKINLEKKMTKLTQNSTCLKCNKPFNKSEILCFLPNGNIIHYKCSRQ
ncbi:hypothetical protein CANINC_003064 [Pichia inconspicua]|uniref:CNH domain-containing protein n=1 Tax=Pichia inconspicua TaxID=52247 RepID=A0A4V4NFK5_9ASCO|nr:hypothetical protein CANINC_003064 [[Candida] inconspicua]